MTREEILKSAKPILFNTDMVRAILDGRKTVTRRAVKPRYKVDEGGFEVCTNKGTGERWVEKTDWDGGSFDNPRDVEPPYHPGDILYVLETYYKGKNCILYKADNPNLVGYRNMDGEDIEIKWMPSIHMPKEAARIFLQVTDVRVERLRDITEEQAQKEGCEGLFDGNGEVFGSGWTVTPVDEFSKLWNSTIKKSDLDRYGWDVNPWVWVIEFERVIADENTD